MTELNAALPAGESIFRIHREIIEQQVHGQWIGLSNPTVLDILLTMLRDQEFYEQEIKKLRVKAELLDTLTNWLEEHDFMFEIEMDYPEAGVFFKQLAALKASEETQATAQGGE